MISPRKVLEDKKHYWWESTQTIYNYIKKQKYLTNNEIDKFVKLIKERDAKISDIIREIKTTKNISVSIIKKIKFCVEEDLFQIKITELFESKKIDSVQYSFASQRYALKDEMILAAWESYLKNEDVDDFIESIKIFSNKLDQHYDDNIHVTPYGFREQSKTKIGNLFESNEHITEKQIQIILFLISGGILTDKYVNDLKILIADKNTLIISAFEIFSITLDHWDFCESLELIAEVYSKNGSKHNEKHGNINKINAIIEEYVDRKDVQGYDKDVLWKLLRTKDPTLFSAIDSYMRNGDLEDFDETMALILKN